MLLELHVENLAVIESATVLFGHGLTAITGESGAGKSVLLNAIVLAVGGRSDPGMVRAGCTEARVDARFVVPTANGAAERVVTRVIPIDGRSRAYIDGRPTTASAVSDMFAGVVEIHAQHEYHRLGEHAVRCGHLDRFGGIDTTRLVAARAALAEIDAELAVLGGDSTAREREIDLLTYQVEEIDQAQLDVDEDVRLADEEMRLSDVDRIRENAQAALVALDDDDDLVMALRSLESTPALTECGERLRAILSDVRDLRSALRSAHDDLEHDPQRLEAVRSRRSLLADLQRRYGQSIADVLDYRQQIGDELDRLRHYDVRAAQLDRLRAGAFAECNDAASEVATHRKRVAPLLSAAVTERLKSLEMGSSTFAVSVDGDDGGDVEFLLDTGNGRSLPISRIASGGELARCMLAIDMVLDPSTAGRCIVFDEIDAGVGGATGGAMASALQHLGRTGQVIAVTHLPTVAAAAAQQITVMRNHDATRSQSVVVAVRDDSRLDEVARMLAGTTDAESLDLARRLLGG